LDNEVSNNVHYLDENTVAYPAASAMVVCKTDVKSQMFIPLTPECKGVTAMAISPDRRFMAVAEAGEESPTISIIDLQTLKKRKGLQTRLVESHVRSQRFTFPHHPLSACGRRRAAPTV
jgi:cilia- and flagella-associated protein 57